MPKQRFAWRRVTPLEWAGLGLVFLSGFVGWATTRHFGEPITQSHARRIAQQFARESLRSVPGKLVPDRDRQLWVFTTDCTHGGTIAYQVDAESRGFRGYERSGLPPQGTVVSESEALAIATTEGRRMWGPSARRATWHARWYCGGWTVRPDFPDDDPTSRPWWPRDVCLLHLMLRADGEITEYSHGVSMACVRWTMGCWAGQLLGSLVMMAGAAVRTITERRRRIAGETPAPLR